MFNCESNSFTTSELSDLLTFLSDRSNIGACFRDRISLAFPNSPLYQGNAKIAGMAKDVGLVGLQYNIVRRFMVLPWPDRIRAS